MVFRVRTQLSVLAVLRRLDVHCPHRHSVCVCLSSTPEYIRDSAAAAAVAGHRIDSFSLFPSSLLLTSFPDFVSCLLIFALVHCFFFFFCRPASATVHRNDRVAASLLSPLSGVDWSAAGSREHSLGGLSLPKRASLRVQRTRRRLLQQQH